METQVPENILKILNHIVELQRDFAYINDQLMLSLQTNYTSSLDLFLEERQHIIDKIKGYNLELGRSLLESNNWFDKTSYYRNQIKEVLSKKNKLTHKIFKQGELIQGLYIDKDIQVQNKAS